MIRLHTTVAVLSMAALIGCGDGDSDDDDGCTTFSTLFPADGVTNAYYRSTIEATFSAEVDQAKVDLSVEGVTGAVTWRDAHTAVFTPDDPLAASTGYTTNLAYDCDGETKQPTASWTTSEVGDSTDEAALIGETFALELDGDTVEIIEPKGIGTLLATYLTFPIYLNITDATSTSLDILGAIGKEEGGQEECTQTIAFPPSADFTANPFFAIGPADTAITIEGVSATVYDMYISGAFAPDGSYIAGATLSGSVDTRYLGEAFDLDPNDPGAVCELAGSIGAVCEPCVDGEVYCLSLVARGIGALNVDEPITEILDPCLLEACSDEPECQ